MIPIARPSHPTPHRDGGPDSSVPDVRHNVGLWIADTARTNPGHLAWADDHERFSYSQAEARIRGLTSWLRDAQVDRGDRIALWLGNRVATLEVLFAAARLGAIVLPINARLTPKEVAFQLDDAEPRLLLVEKAWHEPANEAIRAMTRAEAKRPRLIEVGTGFAAEVSRTQPTKFCLAVSPDDPMILMYTSGTTGKPKGALLPHRKALYNSLNAECYFDLSADDRVLVVAPLFHSLGLQILALPALHAGASVRLQEGLDADRVWRTIAREGITYFGGVPTMHQRLLAALGGDGLIDSPPPSLRFAFTAGAAASKELIRGFHAHGLELKQGYGQTETSILTCLEAENALDKAGSVGRPVSHVELRLIDPATLEGPADSWRDMPVGEVGEIVVRGPTLMLGYWRRPEATAQTIREGWLRTGDLATRDDDFDITLVGRAGDMYISGGENVYPAEIEATLIEHSAVAEAAVVAVADPRWGEVGRAHVVLTEGQRIEAKPLGEWLANRLAAFKRPREIVFESSLPRTASGKVQKNRLRSQSRGGDEETRNDEN